MKDALEILHQTQIDWLVRQGVPPRAIIIPDSLMLARGRRARDGIFEPDDGGDFWLTWPQGDDRIFWRPKTGEIATEWGRTFAIGEDVVDNPGTTALGSWLKIYADPLSWLRANRNGLVVLRWEWAFEWLRDVQRIAVAEEVLPLYKRHMRPRLPELAVIVNKEAAAA